MVKDFLKYFIISFFAISTVLAMATCQTKNRAEKAEKQGPVHKLPVTDPELKAINDEFIRLSIENKVVFTKPVTMGFSEIKKDNVIGQCTVAETWREIDVESTTWGDLSWKRKVILIFHEMIHCHCGRGHDHGDGVPYPNEIIARILEQMTTATPLVSKPTGYLQDGCPSSLMHPVIISEWCINEHYKHYVKEMFNRCKAW